MGTTDFSMNKRDPDTSPMFLEQVDFSLTDALRLFDTSQNDQVDNMP